MKRIAYNILPHDGLRKGKFVLEAERMKEYAQSVLNWIADIPTGVAVIQEHEHGTQELGRVIDGYWEDQTGLWVIAEFEPETYAYVKEMRIKRVSGGFAKGFEDRKGNKRPLVLFELSLVTSPMFHDQKPAQEILNPLPLAPNDNLQRVNLSIKHNWKEIQHPEEKKMNETNETVPTISENLETPEAEEELKEDYEKLEPEEVEEVDPLDVLRERLLAVEGKLKELADKLEPAEEEEVAETEEEEVEEAVRESEEEELRARLQVLRETNGKNTNGWSEDELVSLRMKLPEAYEKKIAEFSANNTNPFNLPLKGEVQTKVLGSTAETRTLSESEAFLKAKEEFEAGGSFLASYLKLTGKEAE